MRNGWRLVNAHPTPRGGASRVRALAAFFAAGGGLCLLAPVLPTAATTNATGIALAGLAALAAAGALAWRPHAVPPWAVHTAVVLGNVLITAVVVLAGAGTTSAVWAPLYVWAPVYVAAYCSRTAFLLHLASTVMLHTGALLWLGQPRAVTRVVLIAATAVVAASVVADLVGRISALADTDALTGLPNRRAFEFALERERALALRRGTPLCVAAIDLNEFKQFNDRHGHGRGDDLLARAAAAWQGRLRRSDVLARTGGDEFALVLPDCTVADAAALGHELLAATPPEVGASLGVAALSGDRSAAQLLAAADAALYDAKRTGGDVVTAPAE